MGVGRSVFSLVKPSFPMPVLAYSCNNVRMHAPFIASKSIVLPHIQCIVISFTFYTFNSSLTYSLYGHNVHHTTGLKNVTFPVSDFISCCFKSTSHARIGALVQPLSCIISTMVFHYLFQSCVEFVQKRTQTFVAY